MDTQKLIKWLKTTAIAAVGGGIAGAASAAFTPSEYHFPHDFGSGKLWKFFFEGFLLTFGALLLKSPLGQKVMTAYKDSQAQLQTDAQTINQAKQELKPPPPKK